MAWNDLSIDELLRRNRMTSDPKLVPGATNNAPDVTPDTFATRQQGSGLFSKIGSLGGTVMELAGGLTSLAGAPYVGVPLSLAGSTIKGGSTGGIEGALKGAGTSAAISAATAGAGKVIEALKAPSDLGAFTALSSQGAPVTVPGIRAEPIEGLMSASNKAPMTIPATPKTFGGS